MSNTPSFREELISQIPARFTSLRGAFVATKQSQFESLLANVFLGE